VSASGDLVSWWNGLKSQLSNYADAKGFQWKISPANSPWRQGQSERAIQTVKRLLKISVGDSRLTPSELQTILYETANLCNDKPMGINRTPEADGSFKVLTPNCLLMGRSSNAVPDDTLLVQNLKKSDRYLLIQQITQDFWQRWTNDVTPEYVIRQKWHETQRNLKPGDLVLVHDKSAFKGKYLMAIVDSVKISNDGRVRSCTVKYRNSDSKDRPQEYTGGKEIKITRSVQRLTLLLAVEDQESKLVTCENSVIKDTTI